MIAVLAARDVFVAALVLMAHLQAAKAARKASRPDATERLATLVEETLAGVNGDNERKAA